MSTAQTNKKYLSLYLDDGLFSYLNLLHEAYCGEVEKVSRNWFCCTLLESALDRLTVSIEEVENPES